MDRNRVTVRYAKALAELASEKGIMSEIDNDVRVIYYALNTFHGFERFLIKQGITSSEKLKRLEQLFGNEFNPVTIKFLKMVINNKREIYLKDILLNTIEIIRIKNNIIQAKLEIAGEIDEDLLGKLKNKFEQKINSTIEITTEINTDLIGGFIFTIDGEQYDASVASKLNMIAKQLQLK